MDTRKQPTASQLAVELARNSSTALCEEHVSLLRDAAQQFSLTRHSSDPTHSTCSTLINVMFDRFFWITCLSTTEDSAHPDPLLDCLICLGEPILPAIHAHTLTIRFIFILLQSLAEDITYRIRYSLEGITAFIREFLRGLHKAWKHEKEVRMNATFHSPMPWSKRSREQGIPPPDTSFEGMPHTSFYDKLIVT